MEEKVMNEIVMTLKGIQEKLNAMTYIQGFRGPVADPAPGWFRGPVADPAPDWWHHSAHPHRMQRIETIMGPVADPGPELMLDKMRLAQLKVRRLEDAITGLKGQIDILELEKNMLIEEHKLKV